MKAGTAIRRGRVPPVLAGAVVSGLGIYAFQVVAARALDGERYAPVAILWTLQYLVFAIVLHPGETYVAAQATRHGVRSAQVRAACVAVLACSGVLSVLAAAVSLLLEEQLLGGDPWLAIVAGSVVLVYGGFVVVRGLLIGSDRRHAYAWATVTDAVLRVVVAALVVFAGATTAGLAWTLPSGAAAVVVWYLVAHIRARPGATPRWRGRSRNRGERASTEAASLRFLGSAALAALLAQTLLAGGPLLLAAADARPVDVSTAFVTFTLARAPLVIGFGGLLSQVVPMVLRLRADGNPTALRSAIRRLAAATAGLTLLSGALGAAAGPAAIRGVFGPSYAPSAGVVALVAGGAVLAGAGLLLNQAGMVLGLERLLPLTWGCALGVAGLLWFALPGDPLARVALAYAGGELAAVLGFLVLARGGVDRGAPHDLRARRHERCCGTEGPARCPPP